LEDLFTTGTTYGTCQDTFISSVASDEEDFAGKNEDLPPLSLLDPELFGQVDYDNIRTMSFDPDAPEEHADIPSPELGTAASSQVPVFCGCMPASSLTAEQLEAAFRELYDQADQLQAQAEDMRRNAEKAKQTLASSSPPGQFFVKSTEEKAGTGACCSPPPGMFQQRGSESEGKRQSWADVDDGNFDSNSKSGPGTEEFTTVMLRNIPNDLLRDDFCAIMEQRGLHGLYNFVYLPIDFMKEANLGYIFVNFTSHDNAVKGWEAMNGFKRWPIKTQKVCYASWSNPMQGLVDHIDRYQNSPVMHKSVPEKFKPILLESGVRVAFPAATRRMKAPRMKKQSA